jgi:hypothetical protein
MALVFERSELSLKQEVATARRFLPKDPRAELIVSELPEKPLCLKKAKKVFEFDTLGGESGGLRRIYATETGIQPGNTEKWYEIYIFGPVDNRRRDLIAKHFGIDPNDKKSIMRTVQVGPYLLERQYFVANKRKD